MDLLELRRIRKADHFYGSPDGATGEGNGLPADLELGR
jgi:hypothetical protein